MRKDFCTFGYSAQLIIVLPETDISTTLSPVVRGAGFIIFHSALSSIKIRTSAKRSSLTSKYCPGPMLLSFSVQLGTGGSNVEGPLAIFRRQMKIKKKSPDRFNFSTTCYEPYIYFFKLGLLICTVMTYQVILPLPAGI